MRSLQDASIGKGATHVDTVPRAQATRKEKHRHSFRLGLPLFRVIQTGNLDGDGPLEYGFRAAKPAGFLIAQPRRSN